MLRTLNKRLEESRRDGGFTLIELLIVIVILGVLAGIVVFAVQGITDRGTTSACRATVKTVEVASEAFYAKNGVYAADIPALMTAPNTFLKDTPPTADPSPGGYFIAYTAADGSVVGNLNGMDFLQRDCANVCAWFRARGLAVDEHAVFGELMAHAF